MNNSVCKIKCHTGVAYSHTYTANCLVGVKYCANENRECDRSTFQEGH